MAERQDALVAASELMLAVREVVTRRPGRQVGTVGRLDVTPNAPNVDSRLASRLTIELRDLSAETLSATRRAIRRARAGDRRAHEDDDRTSPDRAAHAGAGAASEVQRAIERASDALGLRAARLPSGAGHDAQMMAQLGPMGMIFVPSVGGISHSPKELTRWDDCARGADVLLGSVLEIDRIDRLS